MNIYEATLRKISVQNKYLDLYFKIMSHAVVRAPTKIVANSLLGYVEAHHVIPRSFKIDIVDEPDNLVYLTAKEHILAHKLLTKFSTGSNLTSALRAYHCMCFHDNGGRNNRSASLHQLSKAREAARIANSGPRGIRRVPHWSNFASLDEFEQYLRMCVEDDMSDSEIGRKFGISSVSIKNWRTKLNIPDRRRNLRNPDCLRDLYVNQLLSASEIGKIIGCTGTAVQHYLNRFNIPVRDASLRQRLKNLIPTQRQTSKY